MKKREDYLNASADILCKQAYRLCKRIYGAKDYRPDVKELKEACAAIREAAALSASLQKTQEQSGRTLQIVFEDAAEAYAV